MRTVPLHRFFLALHRVAPAVLLFTLFLVTLASCDSAPGPSDGSSIPPSVSGFSYTPRSINILETPPGQFVGNNVRILFTVAVDATDADGVVSEVVLVLRSPTVDAEPVLTQMMNGSGNGPYQLTREVELPRGETGNYTLLIYAVDDEGQLSNLVRGTFTLENRGEPPVIASVEAPDTVQRPAAGEQTLVEIVAVVSDPDGLANLSRVVFWNTAAPADRFDLVDDGLNGGDDVAGDGRYTITVQVASDNAPGPRVFAFQATDRAGLESNVVEKTITIE
ncbi:MAG: hypothetical protein SH809_16485 [Rhodothermales bacterium]|nr:hypothetical protein [Rhodothermales bacterium]